MRNMAREIHQMMLRVKLVWVHPSKEAYASINPNNSSNDQEAMSSLSLTFPLQSSSSHHTQLSKLETSYPIHQFCEGNNIEARVATFLYVWNINLTFNATIIILSNKMEFKLPLNHFSAFDWLFATLDHMFV